MKIDVSKRAITFIRSDEPVARTVANGDGVLLDFNANGELIALELHERSGAKTIRALVDEHPEIEPFMDEVKETIDELMADLPSFSRKRKRRALEMAHSFDHVHA